MNGMIAPVNVRWGLAARCVWTVLIWTGWSMIEIITYILSKSMDGLLGLFAGWCWCWFGLAGAGFLLEENTVGWLVWAG